MKNSLLALLIIPALCKTQDIVISKDTTVNGVWAVPVTTIVRFESNGRISGSGTFQGGIIQASPYQNIFDINLTVKPAALYNNYFSIMWFGASANNFDNSTPINKSINTCIMGGLINIFCPRGKYNITNPIKIEFLYKENYAAVSIHLYGESDRWADRTIINYSQRSGFALGIQYGKGTEVDHLTITGPFLPPTTTGATYYATALNEFGSSMPGLSGLVIDYDGGKNTGGSTACKIHDMNITGFTILYSVSPNARTFNAELLLFENIRCGNARVGFQSGQAQEKNNRINEISSWGSIHTLISIGQAGKFQAGNYIIDGGNVAAGCIRLFDIRQSGWYSSSIIHFFAESIYTIGDVSTGDSQTVPPLSFTDCTFHFAILPNTGTRNLLSSNSNNIKFSNCMLRYYGSKDTMNFSGLATFENCTFSGPIKNNVNGSMFINYIPGGIIFKAYKN